MLTVYSVSWCPHCKKTIRFLMNNQIDFAYRDIERQLPDVVKQVIEANGGQDWVVPTLSFQNQWRAGKRFDENELRKDLSEWGVL